MASRSAYSTPLDVLAFLGQGAKDAGIDGKLQRSGELDPGMGSFVHVSDEESIRDHIGILITTAREEYPPDPEYGCEIWEHEFTSVLSSSTWMDRLENSLLQLVERYEKRLTMVEVKARMDQVEYKLRQGDEVVARLKRRLWISFKARIARTDEPFEFERSLLIAPFSLD